MQPYFNQTRRNKEDDLNIFENGRRHKFFKKGIQPQYFSNERRPQSYSNQRQPKYSCKWNTTSIENNAT